MAFTHCGEGSLQHALRQALKNVLVGYLLKVLTGPSAMALLPILNEEPQRVLLVLLVGSSDTRQAGPPNGP